MIGFVICVGYADYLSWSLESACRWFDRVYLISSETDTETARLIVPGNVQRFQTEAFWVNGAVFNKFAALEECFDAHGRKNKELFCVFDADIIFPEKKPKETSFVRGELTTPFRRMYEGPMPPPLEEDWDDYPRHRLARHFSGYAHFFWTHDPVLRGRSEWYGRRHKTAAAGDTIMQSRWPVQFRTRPHFEVLHIGPSETNWNGRVSQRVQPNPLVLPACE